MYDTQEYNVHAPIEAVGVQAIALLHALFATRLDMEAACFDAIVGEELWA